MTICLLHIGKTGGTYLKSVLEYNKNVIPEDLKILNHQENIKSTRKKFGADRKLAFIYRDPISRFSSGFLIRMRQGRPTYNSMWTEKEAISFKWFTTPNELAEALGSDDDRILSAAHFAMNSIRHLKLGYKYYLGSVENLIREKNNISICVEIKRLNEKLPYIMREIGIEAYNLPPNPSSHASKESSLKEISQKGRLALSEFWKEEFEIYKFCKELEHSAEDRKKGYGE